MCPVALWDEARSLSVSVLDMYQTYHGTKRQIMWLERTQVLFCPHNLHLEAEKWDSFCGKNKMTHRPWHGVPSVTWYLSTSRWNAAFRPEKVWGNPDTHLTTFSIVYIHKSIQKETKQMKCNLNLISSESKEKKGLTLPQFWSARDPVPGTHSPAEHPYPLCCLFLKQIQSLTRKLEHFEPRTLATDVNHLTWEEKVCPKSEAGFCCCGGGALLSLCLVSLSPSPQSLYSGALASSRCGAESNVTDPGCSVLPPPCKGPTSAEGYRHTVSLGIEREGGSVWKEKNVEIWAANLEGHLQLTGIKSAFGFVL